MTLDDFQSKIAKKYNLGNKLVTGHKKTYFDEAAIEFAKFHVEAALQAAADNATTDYEPHWSGEQEVNTYINRASILNSYPSKNIK